MSETQFPDMITVNVTAEQIAHGIQKDCRACPVALAIKKQVPHLEVSVGSFGMAILTSSSAAPGRAAFYRIPKETEEFISNFDRGCKVSPFACTARKVA